MERRDKRDLGSPYVKINLKKSLAEKIEKFIKCGLYRSFSDFVAEAVRLRLEQLENKGVSED